MFSVHSSSYKYWALLDNSLSTEELTLRAEVKAAHELGGGSADARAVADIVTQNGINLSRYHATKFMKGLGLVSCQLPQHAYKKASKEHVAIPNLLERQFSVTAPNQVWCGDVTYVWTGNRWAYLAVVIDLFARKPIDWAMSHSPDSELTVKALTMAYELRERPENLMFHSDQGSHYTSCLIKETKGESRSKTTTATLSFFVRKQSLTSLVPRRLGTFILR